MRLELPITNCSRAQNDTVDPHLLPPKASDSQLLTQALQQVTSIATNPVFAGQSCAACQAILEIAKMLTMAAPEQGPAFIIALCDLFEVSDDCATEFALFNLGGFVTQVFANADVGGLDGQVIVRNPGAINTVADFGCQMICQNFFSLCPIAPASPLNLTGWFAKPKPNPLPPPKKPSGKRLKVLHLSDAHIDPSELPLRFSLS